MDQSLLNALNRFPFYILDGKNVVKADFQTSMAWLADPGTDRTVKRTPILEGVEVSTVFLTVGLHIFCRDYPEHFETMVFGGPHDGYLRRYTVYEEAEAGHAEVCAMLLNEVELKN